MISFIVKLVAVIIVFVILMPYIANITKQYAPTVADQTRQIADKVDSLTKQ